MSNLNAENHDDDHFEFSIIIGRFNSARDLNSSA